MLFDVVHTLFEDTAVLLGLASVAGLEVAMANSDVGKVFNGSAVEDELEFIGLPEHGLCGDGWQIRRLG